MEHVTGTLSNVLMGQRFTQSNTHTCTHLLCLSVCVTVLFLGFKTLDVGKRKHVYLKSKPVCGKRIALLNNLRELMNVAGDMWGETTSNRHIMKSAQCLVSKETLN